MKPCRLILISLLFIATVSTAQDRKAARDKNEVIVHLESTMGQWGDVAQQLWTVPELGYLETQSSTLLQKKLAEAGFSVEEGVAGIPTAFVATFGTGSPVVGILAEFDALPGLAQEAVPYRKPIDGQAAGHGCGHHLFGAGSLAAAVAVKNWMVQNKKTGTIKVFGTPAEEGGSGKVYMVREGLFKNVDVVFHWHPDDINDASPNGSLANMSAKFRFRGVSSHAAIAPELGRSALDGVESMNFMVNMMREHIPSETRIHYVITQGGKAPNVVPDFSEVFYYVRHPDRKVLADIWKRIEACAEGAATGTGTRMDYEIIHGNYPLLPNEVLSKIVYDNLRSVGGVSYTPEELDFAERLRQSEGMSEARPESARDVAPFVTGYIHPGSTDVGDVSYVVPTAGLKAACWVPGTSAHSWQAVAAGGMSIGKKGMLVAAKTLALSMMDIFNQPSLAAKAKSEMQTRQGSDFNYRALLGDRQPPLDYRK
jgi:aminobenzoyl-glutamate utilization protein B